MDDSIKQKVLRLHGLGWSAREIAAEVDMLAHYVHEIIDADRAEQLAKIPSARDGMKAAQRRAGMSTKAVGARIAARQK